MIIEYESENFPNRYRILRNGQLDVSWDEILKAALTVGRPSIFHVFSHGKTSLYEALFRLSLIRMAVEESGNQLVRTEAFKALDPTEKGMVSYFLGMTFCKLFAEKYLELPWLLHLDIFKDQIDSKLLSGRSRPDLVGRSDSGKEHIFECKGRSQRPSKTDIEKALKQARRIRTKEGLNVGAFTYFNSNVLKFFWKNTTSQLNSKTTKFDFQSKYLEYHYEPLFTLSKAIGNNGSKPRKELADVIIEIHPEIKDMLLTLKRDWNEIRQTVQKLRPSFSDSGYSSDGVRVVAGESWRHPFKRENQE